MQSAVCCLRVSVCARARAGARARAYAGAGARAHMRARMRMRAVLDGICKVTFRPLGTTQHIWISGVSHIESISRIKQFLS